MRRSRRHRESLKDYASSTVMERVTDRLRNRHWLLGQCPLSIKEIAALQFTPTEHEAIDRLRGRGILLARSDMQLVLDLPVEYRMPPELPKTSFPVIAKVETTALRLQAEKAVVIFATVPAYGKQVKEIKVSSLPEAMREEAVEWATRWINLELEGHVTRWKVNRALSVCNTMGQIKRLWPSLVSFLPDEAQEKLRQMKVQSKLPEDVLDEGKLQDEWHPDVLGWYENIFTEALLLPDADGEVPTGEQPNRVLYSLTR